LGNADVSSVGQSGSVTLKRRPLLRSLLASAAIAIAVAGCDTDGGNAPSLRSLQPLSAQMVTEIEQKNMSKDSPILIRLFKEESELEVWKQDSSGHFALLKTYPICRWSGELGPKVREGDRQAPEGFYMITPGLMNPNSSYYLAINMGFPNAYDKANGRSGAFLMIHGDCSSRGCYAMTDEQIAEIYALARESFFGGQRAFQIQAMPFRMTALNMAKHRNSPSMPFWRMIKQGYDHFEVTRQEPKVDVCEKRYVFDAETTGRFTPGAKCPAYQVPEDVMAAVRAKQQRDDRETASLVSRGTDTVPVRMGVDGGMHPTFLAAFQKPYTDSAGIVRSARVSLPGTIPAHARPPGDPNSEALTGSVVVEASTKPGTTRVASSTPSSAQWGSSGGGLFGGLFSGDDAKTGNEAPAEPGMIDRVSRMVGLGGSEPEKPAKAKPAPKATQVATARPKTQPKPEKQPDRRSEPQLASSGSRAVTLPGKPPQGIPQQNSMGLNGSQPVAQSGAFENRFGPWN
jgi:murein L,D-transpeptidase YafK